MDLEFPGDVRDARVRAGRNISELERWLSIAAGVGLASYGLAKRRGVPALMLAAGGALLVKRGASGHCDTYQLFGINTAGTGQDPPRAVAARPGRGLGAKITATPPVLPAC